jgi:hypothetical protein
MLGRQCRHSNCEYQQLLGSGRSLSPVIATLNNVVEGDQGHMIGDAGAADGAFCVEFELLGCQSCEPRAEVEPPD